MPDSRTARLVFLPTLLALIVLLGAAWLRATHFDAWPPGLSHDEAINAMDAVRLGRTGVLPYYLRDGRPEPLFRIFLTLTVGLIGPTRFGLRIASLYFGVLGVAAAYRAGRHMTPRREWRWLAGLLAAGTLAIMVGHIHLSRVSYRAILMIFTLLMFFDAFVVAWQQGRRRDFILAGAWLGASLLGYTSAYAVLLVAALGVAHQGIVRLARRRRVLDPPPGPLPEREGEYILPPPLRGRVEEGVHESERSVEPWWRGLLWMGLAFLIAFSPLIVMWIVQPDLYSRAADVSRIAGRSLAEIARFYAGRIANAWDGVGEGGDINPQYNVAQTPLLHVAPLIGLLWAGIAACALRWRRLPGLMALGLLWAMLLPVALSNEIPHGLRISGEYAAIPLVIAASTDLIASGVERARRTPLERIGRLAWWLVASALLIAGGVRASQIYGGFMRSDFRWGDNGVVSGFSWFFETQRQTVAEAVADQGGEVIYVPLTETYHPSFRYFTLRSHPNVTTYARYFGQDGPLILPPGRFLIAPWRMRETSFAAFMPDGTLVLLPRFDDATLDALYAALDDSSQRLTDPYGEIAATVVEWREPIAVEAPRGHTTDINFGDQFRLVGWAGPAALPPEGGEVQITYYFQAGPRLHRDVTIFSQLWTLDQQRIDSSGEPLLLRWVYPPSEWQTADIVPFSINVPVPPGLTPGAYLAAVGLRDWRARHLPVLGADGAPIGETAIAGMLKAPRAEAISTTESMIAAEGEFGGQIALIGYQITDAGGAPVEALSPGKPATVTLYWRALRRPDDNYTVFLHVVDAAEDLAAQSDLQPEGGQYPTGIWDADEIVTTVHVVTPPLGSKGPYTLYAGLYSFPSLARLPVTQGGEPMDDRRAVVVIEEP